MSDTAQSAGNTQTTGDVSAEASQQTAEPSTSLLGEASTQQAPSEEAAAPESAESQTKDGEQAEGDSKPEGAPESYEFKAPEGSNLDPAVVEAFSTVAKDLNLTQEAAQKVVDAVAPAMAKQQAEAFDAYRADLANQARADKEFGGDKLNENLAVAKKALDAFGTPELRAVLDKSGLGNHPEIIRAFYRAGKAISEDKFVSGGTAPTKGERSAADALYGTSTK